MCPEDQRLALLIELIHLRNFLGMMRIHTKKMLPADAGSFKQKEAELSGEYDWKVSFPCLFDCSWILDNRTHAFFMFPLTLELFR